MPKYLTVAQYTLQSAFPTSADPALTNTVLAFTIGRAEAQIDAYMGFDLRLGGFEPHTGWVQQQWDAKRLRVRMPNFPVPVRRALRYQIQVSNLTTSGAGFMATINNNDIAFHAYDFYVEIVPLQSITYSLAPVLVQLGLRPPIVQWDYEAGFFIGVSGETLLNSGDNKNYYAMRGYWASTYTQAPSIQPFTVPPIPPVVYKNGTVQSGYTLNTTEGMVTFTAANQATDVITLDYTYTIPDEVRTATIAQTTWLLGQRALAQKGMTGLWRQTLGKETLWTQRAGMHPSSSGQNEALSFLCEEARLCLMNYQGVPVA